MLEGPLPEQVDHKKLAVESARLEGVMALGRFARFSDYLASRQGDVRIKLQFSRGEGRRTLIVGELSADVSVTCQYCLEPVTVSVASSIDVLVVDSTVALLELPQDQDGLVCETERLILTDVLEDELIVSLPMVPKHANGGCLDISGYRDEGEPGGDTHRPFAGLEVLKKHLK